MIPNLISMYSFLNLRAEDMAKNRVTIMNKEENQNEVKYRKPSYIIYDTVVLTCFHKNVQKHGIGDLFKNNHTLTHPLSLAFSPTTIIPVFIPLTHWCHTHTM